ncbi:MAG TPA: aminopeptidase [Candidatus Enterenecus stercoripullorum]|nr:aminopeptidase [Candidatus Enterenecus stercoripullorum]
MVKDFQAKLSEYARLLVEMGMNVQPGQTPRIAAPVDCAPLARLCVEAAYDCGARDVLMDWTDDFVARQHYLKADEAVFSEFPTYLTAKFDWLLEHECPALSITGSDPELFQGVDPARIQAWQRASAQPTKPYYDAMSANRFQWSIGAYPTRAWAEKVFPDQKGEAAIDALWEAIFSVCRITGDGKGVERWRAHIEATARQAKILNGYNFKSLHYTNSLGTDLTIQLPDRHVWMGGADATPAGVDFVANMPTEEIFTAPRWDGVDGRVYAALPLALDGNLVRDFYLDFRNGKIVNVHAEEGEEVLRHSINLDEGSSYLGEVALVPYDSPIRNTGILFYNTLFDENASCHLAFGSAYPNCVKGGEELDEKGQKAAGLNQSLNHVDFMVGTRDLSIVGCTHDGREVPVFVDGNFAF